jgi:hypothetical protein
MKRKNKNKWYVYWRTLPWWAKVIILGYPALIIARTNLVYGAYHYADAKEERNRAQQDNQDLVVEAAYLTSLRYINTQGFIPITSKNITYYNPSRTGIPPSR